jgi:hypothetical protein
MIQPREDIVWVRADDGRLTPFDADRLTQSIQLACKCAGHHDLLVAESVAAAVHAYVKECPTDVQEIACIVLDVLTMLACDDIARAYSSRGERAEIRLDQIDGFELEFFRELDAALRAATGAEEMAMVQLRGLRACVMRLRGARRWGDSCRAMAEDILDFIRSRAVQARPVRAAALNVEVRE